ncbi:MULTISPECIES: hypothetical protein [unclassified Caballeronia]|uniref:hypothetical protein n=1 Tax=unclassified Caballeronia TaxID=2646786 RepID=UPI002027EC67|nr:MULTISPECIES: hypothetical protein [unclassified Caballeronia]
MADFILSTCIDWTMRDIESSIREIAAQNRKIDDQISSLEFQVEVLMRSKEAA